MIAFTIEKDGYFIDDDFNVVIGKYKKEIQKDIDLFFMDFPANGGDDVLIYKERLEKVFGAKIEDYKSIKRPYGTVDCSEYYESEKYKRTVNDEEQHIVKDSFEGHSGRIGQVGGSISRGGSSHGLLDGVKQYNIETAKDYVNAPKVFLQDAIYWDDKDDVKKIAHILENPVMSSFWANIELAEEKKKKKDIIDHVLKNEYIATPETLMFYLYDGFDGQTSVNEFMKKFGIKDEEYIKKMLNGLSINYPDLISYSDTLGLDVITLKKSKSEKKDFYTISIVDENGDLYDKKTVLASKNEIKEKYGDKVSSIRKETKKARIDGAESIVGDEEIIKKSVWEKIKNIIKK